jgi:hypothetical protein
MGTNFNFKPGFVSLVISNFNQLDPNQLSKLIDRSTSGLDFEILLISDSNSLASQQLLVDQEPINNKVKEKIRSVRTLEAALKVARGDLIAYIENDHLYFLSDLIRGIELMQKSSANLVIGSRNLKILDLKKQIRGVYPGEPIRGFIAYWGSLSLSISLLFKYKRFISDPLAGIKIIRRSALIACDLAKISKDINIILLKTFIQKAYLIEQFEIGYRPENLTKTSRHNFRQGALSLSRIWTDFF